MWRYWLGGLAVLLMVTALRAQDKEKPKQPPASAAEQYQQLLKDYSTAQREFFTKYNAAKTAEEKSKLVTELYPRPDKFATKFMDLAEKFADDPVALKALTWVVSNTGYSPAGQRAAKLLMESLDKDPKSPATLDALIAIIPRAQGVAAAKAVEMVKKHHVGSEKLGSLCLSLVYSRSPDAEDLLDTLVEKSPHHDVQGQASYALARILMSRKGADAKRAEKLLESVVNDFADVKIRGRSLAKMAEGDLFEARFLVVGKVAPEIQSEDIDGQQFKLSEYRGKVVVLDFWGNW